MKKIENGTVHSGLGRLAFRGGTYSVLVTVIVLAILIVVNLCASALPSTLTRYDISAAKLYSITGNTRVVVNSLEKDVTLYWIVQADAEDEVVESLLNNYAALSEHIHVVKKNPDIYPTFAQQYTDSTVMNNSLVVECGDRARYIGYEDIYVQSGDMYSYSYTTSFDGEGALTSAIDYAVSEELPQVYYLEGHGEAALPETFCDAVEKANMECVPLSLLTADGIPEDAACVMIYAPQSDISAEEQNILKEYVGAGGKLLVLAGPVQDASLDNLYGIAASCGVILNEGIVIEADRDHYAFQYPYILLPEISSSEITDPLLEAGYTPILPIAGGMTVTDSAETVIPLLTTSTDSFSKTAGYALESYEKEEYDIDGPFTVAFEATDGTGDVIWFSVSDFLADMYNAYSSGANTDLVMNALSKLVGGQEKLAIRSKSLNYNYLTISEAEGAKLKAVLIGVLPAVYLGIGICVVVVKRRKENEAA